MAKAGVIGNTFGNLEIMVEVWDFLFEKVDYIFHLGNMWVDAENLLAMKRCLIEGKPDYTEADFISDVSAFLEEKARENGKFFIPEDDNDPIRLMRRKLIRIKGDSDPQDDSFPSKRVELLGGRIVILASSIEEIEESERETAEMGFVSFPRRPMLKKEGDFIILCPGRLDRETEFPQSFAIVEVEGDRAEFTFYSSAFKEILKKSAKLKGARFSFK